MKRVLEGVTYNTATATAVASSQYQDRDDRDVEATLYQRRGGAFFIVYATTWAVRHEGQWEERQKHEFAPKSAEEAHKWVLTGETEILANVFPEPPEAAAESTTGATIYLRVPATLKQQIERAAKKADQSVNVWAMRCLESYAAQWLSAKHTATS